MTHVTPSNVPHPPGELKLKQEPEPTPQPEDDMNESQLRLEVCRLKAIAHHEIPLEYQHMIQGDDVETINNRAQSLAELIARAHPK